MQFFSVFLINGFLLSITPSTVTESKCTNQSPVIQDNCTEKTSIPFVLPQPLPQNGTGDIDDKDSPEKNVTTPACPEGKAC